MLSSKQYNHFNFRFWSLPPPFGFAWLYFDNVMQGHMESTKFHTQMDELEQVILNEISENEQDMQPSHATWHVDNLLVKNRTLDWVLYQIHRMQKQLNDYWWVKSTFSTNLAKCIFQDPSAYLPNSLFLADKSTLSNIDGTGNDTFCFEELSWFRQIFPISRIYFSYERRFESKKVR